MGLCFLPLFAPGSALGQSLEQLNIDFNDANGRAAETPFMSSGGRYTVFVSSFLLASDTVAGQVYLYDRQTRQLELISQAANGDNANSASELPGYPSARAVSEDGRYVIFMSRATNLPGTTNPGNLQHIWIRDREEETTSLVSVASNGDPANQRSWDFSMAPNGGMVVFNSSANNLDAADGDNIINTYLHSLSDRTTRLACINALGEKINSCREMTLSCTGGMAFISADDDTSLGDDFNTGLDIFFGPPLNFGPNNFRILSVTALKGSANSISHRNPAVSCDGTRIAFATKGALANNDNDTDWDLYVFDLSTDVAKLERAPGDLSLRPEGVSISASGRWISFQTRAPIAVLDNDNIQDVYAASYSANRVLGDVTLISQLNGVKGNQVSRSMTIADDGSIAFETTAANIVPGGAGASPNILRYVPPAPPVDVNLGAIILLLRPPNDEP